MATIVNTTSPGKVPGTAPAVRPANRTSWLRRLVSWRCLFVLLVLVAVAGGGLHWYLSSAMAARKAAAHLEGVLGVPVEVETIAIGWTENTRLGGMTLYAAGNRGLTPPARQDADSAWLTVNEALADVAALDWLGRGRWARQVDLTGAVLDLRFDRDGHLLTHLPHPRPDGAAWPRLVLHDGRVILRQEGHAFPLDLHGLEGEIRSEDGQVVLKGVFNDPEWGQWDVEGTFQPDTQQIALRLKTDHTRVDRTRLERLPFVSPEVWRQVQIVVGITAVDFTLDFALDAPGVHYRLGLDLQETELHVAAINLHADQASGRVVVANSRVELVGIKGQTAGGRITTSGNLDFRTRPSRMQFDVEVDRLVLHRLPATWKLPEQVGGELTGKARLRVESGDGKVRTHGEGTGEIERPLVLGIPFPRPVPLEMYTQDDRLRFRLRQGGFVGLTLGNTLRP